MKAELVNPQLTKVQLNGYGDGGVNTASNFGNIASLRKTHNNCTKLTHS